VGLPINQKSPFTVRPRFLAGCALVVALLLLPDVVAQSHILERVVLLFAALVIFLGWFLLVRDGEFKTTWRSVAALTASIYLVVSLPVFVFEMSQIKWLMLHPWHHWFSIYARPWVHWGNAFIILSIIGSFLGRSRARTAFVTGSILLLVLRAAMGTWVY